MQKKSFTKYQYIEFVVDRIKKLHEKDEDIDWYFNEFTTLYSPLIFKTCKKLRAKTKKSTSLVEAKTRVIEWLFDAILRYDNKYVDSSKKPNKKFNKVYFSQYLKTKLGWDLHRSLNPSKPDYDDVGINPKYVELDLKYNNYIKDKFIYTPVKYLSENFIGLCRLAQKRLKDDICSDVMMLHYGYDFKTNEIAKMLKCQPKKVSFVLNRLKTFWSEHDNLEKLVE